MPKPQQTPTIEGLLRELRNKVDLDGQLPHSEEISCKIKANSNDAARKIATEAGKFSPFYQEHHVGQFFVQTLTHPNYPSLKFEISPIDAHTRKIVVKNS